MFCGPPIAESPVSCVDMVNTS